MRVAYSREGSLRSRIAYLISVQVCSRRIPAEPRPKKEASILVASFKESGEHRKRTEVCSVLICTFGCAPPSIEKKI